MALQLPNMTTKEPQCHLITAPQRSAVLGKSVFLAGAIDNAPEPWRSVVIRSMSTMPITILDPYRADWSSSFTEDISCIPFREQVEWELDMMGVADLILLYFTPESQAPISLLELGMFARSGKMLVACPDGYWKRGNVQVVCQKFGVELVDNLEELIRAARRRLTKE